MFRRFTNVDGPYFEMLALRSNDDRQRGGTGENRPQCGWAIPSAMKHDHNDGR
jgi:hypothetical protein